MNSKKKSKQEKKREEEVFDALCKIMEVTLSTFNEYKITPIETFRILNSMYTRVCDMVIEHRKEGITEEYIKLWIANQVNNLMDCILNQLPIKENEDEQE